MAEHQNPQKVWRVLSCQIARKNDIDRAVVEIKSYYLSRSLSVFMSFGVVDILSKIIRLNLDEYS
jgi:hypothetical protein